MALRLDGVMVLGKELRRFPDRGLRELRARSAAASVALRDGARLAFALEARLRGQERSGSQLVVEALEALDADRERLVVDERTRSTREEVLAAHRLAHEHGLQRIALVTHGYHVPRVRRYMEATFPAGRAVVLTPESFLQRARGLERDWIEAATPDEAVYAQEARAERVLGGLAAALSVLPRGLAWQVEVKVGGLYRSVT